MRQFGFAANPTISTLQDRFRNKKARNAPFSNHFWLKRHNSVGKSSSESFRLSKISPA
jgi:hypothetical protein